MRTLQFRKFNNVSIPVVKRAVKGSSKGVSKGLPMHWSDECRAFVDHWAGLREEGVLMPTSDRFMDRPSSDFTPSTYIVDIENDVAVVRFQGSALEERWGASLTGQDIHGGQAARFRQRSILNMNHVIAQPCGYLAMNTYTTSYGREVTADLVQLPLSTAPGRPPRLVCYVGDDPDRSHVDKMTAFTKTIQLDWLDLGAGIPAAAPLDLLS